MKRNLVLSGLVVGFFLIKFAVLDPGLTARPSWAAAPYAGATEKVRPPSVAGSFYPGDAKELTRAVDEYLAKAAATPIEGQLVAITVPHAGYEYSGQVAAHSFALLKGRKFERVVVISPCHIEAFDYSSIFDGDAYSTPLGTIPVDRDFAKRLAAESPMIRISGRGHGIVQGRAEHSLEVELPFL